jgi:hypothetical protein
LCINSGGIVLTKKTHLMKNSIFSQIKIEML